MTERNSSSGRPARASGARTTSSAAARSTAARSTTARKATKAPQAAVLDAPVPEAAEMVQQSVHKTVPMSANDLTLLRQSLSMRTPPAPKADPAETEMTVRLPRLPLLPDVH